MKRRFTERQVELLRLLHKRGKSTLELARIVQAPQSTVWRAVNREHYRDVAVTGERAVDERASAGP